MLDLQGLPRLMDAVRDLGRRTAGAIQRKAVTAGAQEVLQVMRLIAPQDTRTLRKSLGKKVKVYKDVAVGIVGPRSDFRRTVRIGRRDVMKRPVRYAHLAERSSHFAAGAVIAAQVRAMDAMEKKAAEELEKRS